MGQPRAGAEQRGGAGVRPASDSARAAHLVYKVGALSASSIGCLVGRICSSSVVCATTEAHRGRR